MSKAAPWLMGFAAYLLLTGCERAPREAAPAPGASVSVTEPPAARAAEVALAQTRQSEAAAVAYSRAFYEPTTTLEQRLDALAPGYVEHGPLFVRFNELNDVQGREGLRLMFETLSRLRGGGPPIGAPAGASARSQRPRGNVLYQVVAEGDRVIVLNQQFQPYPQRPGKFYETFVFDAFRMDHGKIAEHWDDTTIAANPPGYLREPVAKMRFPKPTRPIYGSEAAPLPPHSEPPALGAGLPTAQAAESAQARAALAAQAQTRASRQAAVAYSRAFYQPTTTMQQRLDALTPDYVDHGALFARFNELNHVQGRESMRLVLETISRLRGGGPPIGPRAGGGNHSQRPPGNVLYQVIAQGDHVVVLNQQFQPDPQHPGKFYETFVFDAFRVDHGKIAEHWDDTTLPAKLPIFLREPVSEIHFPTPTRAIYGLDASSR